VSDERPNPDALLSAIQKEEAAKRRGQLKVFLGMCPGVGKTYAMLEAARREQAAGRDVVIGYVETHGRKETDGLAEGLPKIPRRLVEYRGVALTEMDLDAVLTRKPQLALVDELAHTNAPGSRHPKRYQDVQELLDACIDVFTTLNVQHVESRAEIVREVIGATIQETVPDSVLDQAEIELVDLPAGELLKRLAEGKVYVPDRAQAAASNFFREGNLIALRELALRLGAEHVGQDVREYLQSRHIAGPWKTGQRLLVAISPSPLSESMARWTRRLADNLQAPWLAIYVDTGRPLSDEEQTRLQKNLTLARELGAEVITTSDQDVVSALLRVARQHNVTQIVVGKPAGFRALDLLRGGSMLSRLIRDSGNIDVHCVRTEANDVLPRAPRMRRFTSSSPRQYLSALLAVALTTGFNLIVSNWTGYYVVSLVYLLLVVTLGLFVGRGPNLLAAALSALLWNFLFVPPLYTFVIANLHDALMFGALFVVALAMGQLTTRLRAQQAAEREREERATALYLLTRELAEAKDFAELLGAVIRQLGTVFKADVAVLLPDTPNSRELVSYPFGTLDVSEKEASVAAWAFRHAKPAGHSTDTLPSAEALYSPLVTPAGCVGIIGLRLKDGRELSVQQRNLLDSFLRQIALVLDRQRLRETETEAKLLAESERLGKTLLNSVSHELRTPLAAITSAASSLRDAGPLTRAQQTLAAELDEATARLNRLVRNLLDLSRLEAGHLHPNLDWHDVRDLVHTALQNLGRTLAEHPVKVDIASDLLPAKFDFTLTEQILANLLSNAAVHTPAGTPIEVRARAESSELVLEVADGGAGLPPGNPARLFDRFQRGADAAAGGTGIGLSLVKGFAEAQDGSVTAANRDGGGAIFTLRLPLSQMPPVPQEKE
jgi:two-component system sensor histidine kinase KdpD